MIEVPAEDSSGEVKDFQELTDNKCEDGTKTKILSMKCLLHYVPHGQNTPNTI